MRARPARHLALVELDDQGEITGRVDSEALQALEGKAEKLATDLANAERDLRAKRRRIAELERDLIRERLDHPDRAFIKRVCGYWHAKCRAGNARIDALAPNRFDAVAALAEMQVIETVTVDGKKRRVRRWRYEAEHFKAAIDGAAFDPFETTHKNGKVERHNDLAQICKDVTRFERAIEKAPYEPVPLPGFKRLAPDELAHARGREHNPVLSSKVAADSAARSIGGQHGRTLASGGSRPLVRAEDPGLGVRWCLDAGVVGVPASWA